MGDVPGAATFRRPAEAYDRYIGRYGPPLAGRLMAHAGVRPGHRAVDVGCGPGALTGELAALLGAEHVAAVDPSPPFAEACARRHPGVRVEVGAAEALPFGDAAFDHALAQLVLTFLTDAPSGVREMRRVTRPGGGVSAAVWDYAHGMTLLRAFWDVAVVLDPAAVALDEGRARFCSPDELRGLWRAAGLDEVRVTSAEVRARYDAFDDLWAPLEAGVGPAGAYAAGLHPGRRSALRDALRDRLGAGDRPFELAARAWLVTGRVPQPSSSSAKLP